MGGFPEFLSLIDLFGALLKAERSCSVGRPGIVPFPQECRRKRPAAGPTGRRMEASRPLGCDLLCLKGSSIHHGFVLKEVEGGEEYFAPFQCWTVWRVIIRGA